MFGHVQGRLLPSSPPEVTRARLINQPPVCARIQTLSAIS